MSGENGSGGPKLSQQIPPGRVPVEHSPVVQQVRDRQRPSLGERRKLDGYGKQVTPKFVLGMELPLN